MAAALEEASGQLSRLLRASLRVRLAPELIDVDTAADAHEVAREAPDSRFAATLLAMGDKRDLVSPRVLGEPDDQVPVAAVLAGWGNAAGIWLAAIVGSVASSTTGQIRCRTR